MPEISEFISLETGVPQRRPAWADTGREALPGLISECMAGMMRHDFFSNPLRKSIVEVGAWAGANALDMAEMPCVDCVYCVDHWRGNSGEASEIVSRVVGQRGTFKVFCRNTSKLLFRKIVPLVGSSGTWASVWPQSARPGMVYIDAGHREDEVEADIRAWWPLVLPGGLLAGHDYLLFPGVKRACDRFGISGHSGEIWYRWKPYECQA